MSSPVPLRTIYFGTPDFAVPALRALIEAPVAEVVAVVSQPDRPSGRGRRRRPTPTKQVALEHGIPVVQPERPRDEGFLDEIAALEPDIGVVAAYGRILPRAVLELPRHGCVNIHASLLPRHRGAAPIQWAIMEGAEETGVTIMQMDEGCDTGPIIAQERCRILEDDDARSLSDMLSMLGAKVIVEVLGDLQRTGGLVSAAQDESQATHARLLRKEDGKIDWGQPAAGIDRRIRGLNPWPAAQTTVEGRPLKILQAEPIPAEHPEAAPGEVVESDSRRGFVVKTGLGHLLVTRVQPAGKAPMSGADAANGGHVRLGTILGALSDSA